MSGFFGGRSDVFQKVIAESGSKFERKGFKVLFDLLKFAPKDITVGETLFTFNARRGGESKLNSHIILSILRQCGVGGKLTAAAATFFLMKSIGRFTAAILFGLLSTFAFISLAGGNAWTNLFNDYTFFSLILALMYMVVASEMIMKWRGESIIRGLSLISVALSAYLLNLAIFYYLAEILPEMLMMASLLGLTIAFGFDTALGFKRYRPVMVR
jgi:dolichol-phosphate mannosyltransferase